MSSFPDHSKPDHSKPDHSKLTSIFPPFAVPAGEILGVGPEASMYNQHFGGKVWPDVKRKYFERHTDAYSLMDRPSLKHYIAGFVDVALTEPSSTTAEFLVYFVGSKEFVEFCSHLNVGQVSYLLKVVDWLVTDEYYSEKDRSRIDAVKATIAEHGSAGLNPQSRNDLGPRSLTPKSQ